MMRTSMLLVALLLLPIVAGAAPEGDPRFSASPELRAQFEAQRQLARVPRRSTPYEVLEAGTGEPLVANGRLERLIDGAVLLAVLVTPEQAEALVLQGLRRITEPKAIAPATVLGDRAYFHYRVGPSSGDCPGCVPGLLGPEASELERKVGQEVTLRLARDGQGRLLVVGIGDPR